MLTGFLVGIGAYAALSALEAWASYQAALWRVIAERRRNPPDLREVYRQQP